MTNEKDQNRETMARAFAQREVNRLKQVRRKYGDEFWAQCLGDSIVSNLTLISYRQQGDSQYLAEYGKLTLLALEPQILELYKHPQFGGGMAEGIIKELASRRYLSIDVEELYHPPYRPEPRSR